MSSLTKLFLLIVQLLSALILGNLLASFLLDPSMWWIRAVERLTLP
jgi:hypothetical protein